MKKYRRSIRILSLILCGIMLLGAFSACGGSGTDTDTEALSGTEGGNEETPTEKITDKQTETEKATEKQTETEKATDKQTETEKATDKQTETEKATDKQTETEKQTEKETEKVTEKQTEKQTEKTTEKEEACLPYNEDGKLRILELGNSFGFDGIAQLYPLLKKLGYKDIVIVASHYPSCTIEQYNQFIKNNSAVFWEYRFENSSTAQEIEKRTFDEIISYGEWDVISIMNHSSSAGVEKYFTSGELDKFINTVKEKSPNSDFDLYWYSSWAYRNDYEDSVFKKFFNSDQETMFNGITSCLKKYIATNDVFKGFIPAGTAVQNLRSRADFVDLMERDNFHMSLPLGRYVTALTYACVITGKTPEDITYRFSGITSDQIKIIKAAVAAALADPYTQTDMN